MQRALQEARAHIGDTWADLISVDGMGEAAAGSLVDFFNTPNNAQVIQNLLSHITIIDAEPIVIKAQNHRVQERNREDGLKRLKALLEKALYVAPARRATRPTWGAINDIIRIGNGEKGRFCFALAVIYQRIVWALYGKAIKP